jgi:hypothetical protein
MTIPNYRDPSYRDRYVSHPNRNTDYSGAPTAYGPQARAASSARYLPPAAPKSASRVSKGLLVSLVAVAALSVGAGLVLGEVIHTSGPGATTSAAAPNSAATPVASGPVTLPADLCALNSPDSVAATVGFAGPALIDPVTQQTIQDMQRDHPEVRQCFYNASGGSVHVVLRKGVTREQFDASQTQASAGSGQTNQATQGASTYTGTLSGVADAAFGVTTTSHAFGGTGVGASVVALDGDTQIDVIASSADRVDPAKVADLVRALVGELH